MVMVMGVGAARDSKKKGDVDEVYCSEGGGCC